ncbi:GNAT family N-acetyltransferase [Bradyrhizobium zhanjiangense]|uniref:GNAT family N-acetyltransferase n=2 Tax=Bradyrhizobium zhanjiangense TaxID=1325107 RepID=A0A4Q0Q3N3_9BRAD|nr:GNAT family N-acetyltransferase [Bradyrhizobium zhanjiangense]
MTPRKVMEQYAAALKALSHWDESRVTHLKLSAEQEEFVDSVEIVFAEFRSCPEEKHPFSIVVGDKVVGFFVLRERTAVPEWAPLDTITLHSLRIDPRHQRKGYGTAAVRLAAQWILTNRPCVHYLMLAVNARNVTARNVYLKSGFRDTGATYLGPIGIQNILEYKIG